MQFKSLISSRSLVIPTIRRGTSCLAFGATLSTLQAAIYSSAARWLGCYGLREWKTYKYGRTLTFRKSENTNALISFRSSNLTHDLVFGSGRLSAVELRDHMAALAKHLSDPETTLIDRLVVQAWGTRPN